VSLRAIYSHSFKSAHALAILAGETFDTPAVYHDQGGKEGDLDALLARKDIDAVIIALPITVQPEIIKKCFEAGKHVLSEKPVAPDVKQGEALIKEYEEKYRPKGVKWRVAENFECEPAYRFVRTLIEGDKIGKVGWWTLTSVGFISKDSKWYKTPWRTVPEVCAFSLANEYANSAQYQGGFLLDGGVHFAAILRTALPSHPVSLSGYATLLQSYLPPQDTFTVTALSSDGSHGTFELAQGAPASSRTGQSFNVTGEKGWIRMSQTKGVYKVELWVSVEKKVGEETKHEEVKEEWEIKSEGVEVEVGWFVDDVSGKEGDWDGKHAGNPREALRDVAFIEAGLKSNGEKMSLQGH